MNKKCRTETSESAAATKLEVIAELKQASILVASLGCQCSSRLNQGPSSIRRICIGRQHGLLLAAARHCPPCWWLIQLTVMDSVSQGSSGLTMKRPSSRARNSGSAEVGANY